MASRGFVVLFAALLLVVVSSALPQQQQGDNLAGVVGDGAPSALQSGVLGTVLKSVDSVLAWVINQACNFPGANLLAPRLLDALQPLENVLTLSISALRHGSCAA